MGEIARRRIRECANARDVLKRAICQTALRSKCKSGKQQKHVIVTQEKEDGHFLFERFSVTSPMSGRKLELDTRTAAHWT